MRLVTRLGKCNLSPFIRSVVRTASWCQDYLTISEKAPDITIRRRFSSCRIQSFQSRFYMQLRHCFHFGGFFPLLPVPWNTLLLRRSFLLHPVMLKKAADKTRRICKAQKNKMNMKHTRLFGAPFTSAPINIWMTIRFIF